MALISEVVKERLRDAFGSDSQETVGRKLNMTQGNVSKILSGSQQPTIDTLVRVAEVYDVSIDWLTGLSDKRKITKIADCETYTSVTNAVHALVDAGAGLTEEVDAVEIKIRDPLAKALIKKSLALSKTDWELFLNWKEARLSMFDDKELISRVIWEVDNISFLAGEASSEQNWLQVYDVARTEEENYREMMAESPGPFEE